MFNIESYFSGVLLDGITNLSIESLQNSSFQMMKKGRDEKGREGGWVLMEARYYRPARVKGAGDVPIIQRVDELSGRSSLCW